MKTLVGNRVDAEFVDRKSLLWPVGGGMLRVLFAPYRAGLSNLIWRKPRKPASRANYAGIQIFSHSFPEIEALSP